MADEPRITGMDTDIRDELEQSFGDGPRHPDTAALVALGRRQLRRRRLAEAATGLVVASVAITGAVVAGGGSPESGKPPIAGTPSATPTTSSGPSRATDPTLSPTNQPYRTVVGGGGLMPGINITLTADGVLHVRRGVKVIAILDNPWSLTQPGLAVAVSSATTARSSGRRCPPTVAAAAASSPLPSPAARSRSGSTRTRRS